MQAWEKKIHDRTDAALVRSASFLREHQQFADAFHILRLLVERGSNSAEILGELIDSAEKAAMLDACADFLVALAYEHPHDSTLLNHAAGVLGTTGRKAESRFFAEKAAAVRPFFRSSVKDARLTMLVLQCAANGDYRYSPRSKRFFMPGVSDLYTLLDPHVACHRLLVDDLPAAMDALHSLPQCDLVFNAISDPDYEQSLKNAAALCDAAGLPVFNTPRHVRILNRQSLPRLVRDCPGVVAARSLFLPPGDARDDDIMSAMREHGLEGPVIVRAPGFQGGKHMALVEESEKPASELYRGNGLYVIEFMDVSFHDDRAPETPLYPKYRAFYVNGKLYPMHLFFADQYEVHKKTSDPVHARYPWLLEYEAEFLRDPREHLPQGSWDALTQAMASFGLDYFGVDFAVSTRPQDRGKLVLFECNPSMRNWLTLLPDGDRVQRKWREVTLAAHAALCTKGQVRPWNFSLKRGKQVQ